MLFRSGNHFFVNAQAKDLQVEIMDNVEKVEVVRRGKVRRAKLNYLRDRVGKKAKVKELVK